MSSIIFAGVSGQIRTDGFSDLQSDAMGRSATDTLPLFCSLYYMPTLNRFTRVYGLLNRLHNTRPSLWVYKLQNNGVPYRIRTGVDNVKGWCPRPLDERDIWSSRMVTIQRLSLIKRVLYLWATRGNSTLNFKWTLPRSRSTDNTIIKHFCNIVKSKKNNPLACLVTKTFRFLCSMSLL